MKLEIVSVVPTHYQHQSISRLMGVTPPKEGSRYAVRIPVDSLEEAQEWMRVRNNYLWGSGLLTDEEYEENKQSIAQHWPTMGYDAATCGVREVES